MTKTYTIEDIRKWAGTIDVYKTKAGYVYKRVKGKKVYIRVPIK